ncbi:MAG TPA: ABC transporter permease subunit [Kofleriaceae bacterium]|nr:ABC transporter permease subunit [Kofleriaceae bacterium]
MTAPALPGALSTVWTLAAVTLRRLVRGKGLWIGAAIAALPSAFASVAHARGAASPDRILNATTLALAVLPAMFVASSIADEIEARTITYLWSRPIARWAVLAGKLCALAPIVIALVVGGWVVAGYVGLEAVPPVRTWLAIGGGCLAACLIAMGITTVVPRHAMALTIGYLLVDNVIGLLPFSMRELSIMHQTRVLSGVGSAAPALGQPLAAMAVVAGLWAVVGLVRIGRMEA